MIAYFCFYYGQLNTNSKNKQNVSVWGAGVEVEGQEEPTDILTVVPSYSVQSMLSETLLKSCSQGNLIYMF